MSDHIYEEEQVEKIKRFWRDYGRSILFGVVFALLASLSWRAWQQHQRNRMDQASQQYEEMVNAVVNNEPDDVLRLATTLYKQFSRTAYAKFAALTLAQLAVQDRNYPEAESKLIWVMNTARDQGMQQIARLRAARILLAQDKAQAALQLLAKANQPQFDLLTNELRGDAYAKLGKQQEAWLSYQKAQQALPNATTVRPILKMKINAMRTQDA